MPSHAGSLCATKEQADQKAGDEELDRGRHSTAPVPAAQPVAGKELAAARPRKPDDVLQVGARGRQCAGHRGIERPAHSGEEKHGGDT